ncbi:MAG: CDP-glycerol glycerophosphotransferase family protein, partial [Candidatus Hadarchaeales archaeon]
LLRYLDSLDWLLASPKHSRYLELFRKYKPDLVFSTNILRHTDWKLVQTARRAGVPVISMVANWDHLTKGILPPSDFVIAWSEFNRKELMSYYGYHPNQIAIVGIPHQDYFVRVNPEEAKRKIRTELGLKEEKLILYTTARSIYYEPEIVEILCEAVRKGEINFPVHVHVRVHPEDNYARYRHIEEKYGDFVTFEGGGKTLVPRVYSVKAQTEMDTRGKMWLPDEGDMIHYAELLYSCDVAVNIASSVTLDSVAVDKPTVNIAFDGYRERPFIESTRRYFYTTHYKVVAKSGGVKIARNPKELVDFINMYLENPELDREGRRKIVEESGGPIDGKCGERIAKAVLEFLKKTSG